MSQGLSFASDARLYGLAGNCMVQWANIAWFSGASSVQDFPIPRALFKSDNLN